MAWYLKCQVFKTKRRTTEVHSFILWKGLYFISAPGRGRREGQHLCVPYWKWGTWDRHLESSLLIRTISSDPKTQRSWRLVLCFVHLALCHICNCLCKVLVSSVFSSQSLYFLLLIHQCHPCQWFMNSSYSQTPICVAFETNGVVWVSHFLWCRYWKGPGTVGRSEPVKKP